MSLPTLPRPEDLDAALRGERPGFRKLLSRIREAQRKGKPHDRNLKRLTEGLAKSAKRRAERAERIPAPSYPAELPVSQQRGAILDALREHQVVVVCGETGSGKSTQLPKLLLELGLGVDGPIGHTQPRRVAARTIARRVAAELGTPLGQDVGYKVRFQDSTSPHTFIKVMTDGVLLAETRRDPQLLAYDAIIVDEAHERSLNVDFLLGYLLRLLPRRPELKLVVTSATLDAERFAEWLGQGGEPAPVVEVGGRLHPVELRHEPPEPDVETGEVDMARAVADACQRLLREAEGDVLVFLPTERDILECTKVLRGRSLARGPVDVLPLFARLPAAEQQKVFDPDGSRRRIVLATNVAESSVTVPGIRAVVDTGTARTSRYSPRTRVQRLPIEPIAQAAARQRAGRCGRLGPGVCVRLYAEDDLLAREEYTTPEIQRSNLAAVMLQMADLRLGRVEDFPFLDPPRRSHVADGRNTLRELGALDDDDRLTAVGKALARVPVDPRFGRMLLEAREQGVLADMLILVAALETGDPRDRPPGKEGAADALHASWADGESDLRTLLKLWDVIEELGKRHGRRRKFAVACRRSFLSPARCREWRDVHTQLSRLVERLGWQPGPRRDDRDALHRSVLAGFPTRIAERKAKHEYTAPDGSTLWIWPGSAVFERKPRWIVAAEILETDRRWARGVARIDPRDVERYADALVKRSYGEPQWDRHSGRVVADERVSLGQLVLVPRRRVWYEHVDPVIAREVFIRALAEGDVNTGAPFLTHNVDLVNRVAALEARTRQRGLLADLDVRYDFYDRLLPAEVTNAANLQRFRRKVEKADPAHLFMTLSDLLRGDVGEQVQTAYPERLVVDGQALELVYSMAPGEAHDGVTLRVPMAQLERLPAERLEWLVPGWLREKAIALVRSLPKEDRRHLVPIPESVDAALLELPFGEGPLLPALARALTRAGGLPIRPQRFRTERVPETLSMRLEVLDERGRVVDSDRDLPALRRRLGRQTRDAVADLAERSAWHRDDVQRWDFGRLPAQVELPRGEGVVLAHPALVDAGETAALRLLPRADQAAVATRAGVRRLVVLAQRGRLVKRLRRQPEWSRLQLLAATLPGDDVLEARLVERVVERAWLADAPDVRDEAGFLALLRAGEGRWLGCLEETVAVVRDVLDAWHGLRSKVEACDRPRDAQAVAHVEQATARLMERRPIARAPWPWLAQVPRLLRAAIRRLERLDTRGIRKDDELSAGVRAFEQAHDELAAVRDRADVPCPPLDDLFWMLEEYRVSVYAQELGTAVSVSPERLSALVHAAREQLDGFVETRG